MSALSLPTIFYADRTARGRLRLTGRDRQSFLQGMVSNDIAALTPGDGCYAFVLDATAHVLADMRALCGPNYLLLDVEPGMAPFVAATLERYLIMEKCRITDVTDEMAQVLIGGADAARALHDLFGIIAGESWREGQNAAATLTTPDDTLVAAVRLIPGPAYDVYVPAAERDALVACLAAAGIAPIADDLLESLRVEAGVPRFGIDMDAKVLAPETGQQARAIHRRKGCYIGQEIVARIDARGHTNRTFAGFVLPAGADPPAPGTPVEVEGREAGRITSSALSPTRGMPIALGYIRIEYAEPGTPVIVGSEGAAAQVAALPFADTLSQ